MPKTTPSDEDKETEISKPVESAYLGQVVSTCALDGAIYIFTDVGKIYRMTPPPLFAIDELLVDAAVQKRKERRVGGAVQTLRSETSGIIAD